MNKTLDDRITKAMTTYPVDLGSYQATTVVPEAAIPALKALIEQVCMEVIGQKGQVNTTWAVEAYWQGQADLRARQRTTLTNIMEGK